MAVRPCDIPNYRADPARRYEDAIDRLFRSGECPIDAESGGYRVSVYDLPNTGPLPRPLAQMIADRYRDWQIDLEGDDPVIGFTFYPKYGDRG